MKNTNVFKMVDGETVELTEAENNQRLAASAAAQAERDARAWLDGRLAAYPTIPEQLDNIFHNGLDVWRADIQAIKDEFPKPA
tara:strand:+ start:2554 stop:2802 length:249 start_codon:yes stop_codon:yes gene_type:complete